LHLCKKSFILPWKEILDESSACTNKKPNKVKEIRNIPQGEFLKIPT
jgi:hypothetical protein